MLASAQEPPLLPVPQQVPEKAKPAPSGPPKVESTLPEWKNGQPEKLGMPDPLKPFCPPGLGVKSGSFNTEPCDQNVPVIACPSPQDLEVNSKYVGGAIDPKNTITLYDGRTRLLELKQTPKRVQIGDEKIVDYTLITPKQISLLGKETGEHRPLSVVYGRGGQIA